MKLRFWGVRGSLPTPGPTTYHYGGNTTCLQIIRDEGPVIIIDAGTGIRELGNYMMRDPGPPFDIKLLITHTHWDHIHGFPFFTPIYIPGGNIDVYGVGPIHQGISFEKVMRDQMTYSYFPVENQMLDGVVNYYDFQELFASRPSGVEGEFELCEGVKLKLKLMNHPVYTIGYRVEADGQAIVFTGDHEPYYDTFEGAMPVDDDDDDFFDDTNDTKEFVELMNQRIVDFISGADLLVIDTTYTKEEYYSENNPALSKKGWGHGYFRSSFDIAKAAGVKKMAYTHHDPTRADAALAEIEKKWIAIAKEEAPEIEVFCAREGMTVDMLTPTEIPEVAPVPQRT